jgi:hypothetical protein
VEDPGIAGAVGALSFARIPVNRASMDVTTAGVRSALWMATIITLSMRKESIAVSANLANEEAAKGALVDEVQRRLDAVVDTAVAYIQNEPEHEWEARYDALEAAVGSLLELRGDPAALAAIGSK